MGWASGGELADRLWSHIRKNIKAQLTQEVFVRTARFVIDCFEEADCDTVYECEQLWKDAKMDEFEDKDGDFDYEAWGLWCRNSLRSKK